MAVVMASTTPNGSSPAPRRRDGPPAEWSVAATIRAWRLGRQARHLGAPRPVDDDAPPRRTNARAGDRRRSRDCQPTGPTCRRARALVVAAGGQQHLGGPVPLLMRISCCGWALTWTHDGPEGHRNLVLGDVVHLLSHRRHDGTADPRRVGVAG